MNADPSKLIADWLEASGTSQQALAAAAGVHQTFVSAVVAGRRRPGPTSAPAFEAATGIRAEALCPDVEWLRDSAGQITGYHVPLRAAG